MPSARTFVEDSDDDDDLMSPVKNGEDSAVKQVNGITTQGASGGITNGTTSTGQLAADMQKAHDALFASVPTLKRGLEDAAHISFHPHSPTTEAKRRRTTSETGLMELSSTRRERGKTVKTYGQTGSSGRLRMEDDFSAFKALQDGDRNLFATERRSSHERQLQEDAAAAWNMRGSLLQDFAEHDPVAMFPTDAETESTVPNNTETQRRLVQEAISAQDQSSMDSRHSPARLSEGSLGSSAFRTTQATNRSPPAMKSSNHSQSSARDHRNSQLLKGTGSPLKHASHADADLMPPPLPNESTPDRRIRRSQSAHTPTTPKFHVSQEQRSTTPQASPPAYVLAPLAEFENGNPVQARDADALTRRPHSGREPAQPERVAIETGVVQDSKNEREEVITAIPTTAVTKKRRKRNEVEALEKLNQSYPEGLSSDDIAAIGLPKEQYKPRPSRSRSAQVSYGSVDYSALPEKAANLRSKRRRTVDSFGLGVKPDGSPDAHKITAISSMGFTPSRAEKALSASNGNLEDAIDILINTKPTTAEKIVANKIAAALKTYSPERQRSTTPSKQVDSELRQPRTESRVVVNVAVPFARANRREKDEERLSLHEDDLLKEPGPDLMDDDSPPRKRGRARQKQIIMALEDEDEETDDCNNHSVTVTRTSPDKTQMITRKPGRPRKTVPRVLTEDEAADIEAGLDLEETMNAGSEEEEIPVESLKPPKKRTRGRPKSAKQHVDPIEIHCDNDPVHKFDAEIAADGAPSEVSCTTALREVDTNTNTASMTATTESPPLPPHGTLSAGDDPRKTQTATPESSPARPPPPATPTRLKDVSNAQHSPLSKGKVPYRVGLSRKVRIPSLLKVMKK